MEIRSWQRGIEWGRWAGLAGALMLLAVSLLLLTGESAAGGGSAPDPAALAVPGAGVQNGPTVHVNYAHDWVYVYDGLEADVAITVTGAEGVKATVTGQTGQDEYFGSWEGSWEPEHPDIVPGDVVTAVVDGAEPAVNPVGVISGVLDVTTDVVSGTIHAAWFEPSGLTVGCGLVDQNGDWQWLPEIPAVPANGGSFFCDFANEGWDIDFGQDVIVRYYEPDFDSVFNVFRVEELGLRVNYGHDWVESFYEPGHTAWVTVTGSDGTTIKATAVVTTGDFPWSDNTGFQTAPEDWQPGPGVDIEAYDWVYGRLDNGATAQVQVGPIEGLVNVGTDSISGTIYTPWFTDVLQVECHSWGKPDPEIMKYDQVMPDGVDTYNCSWDPTTEWDIQLGQEVGVGYSGLDGHWVANAFAAQPMQLRVNYGHDWVESFYEPGHTAWVTVTGSNGWTIKATAVVTTGDFPWSDNTGFQTAPDDWQPGPGVDVRPYDWVYGRMDNGAEAKVQVGLIKGLVNVDTDSISGTIYTPWFTDELDMECKSWGKAGPEIQKYDRVMPDGVDPYSCSWDPDTEWDIELGQEVGVGYFGLDENWVATAFSRQGVYLPLVLRTS